MTDKMKEMLKFAQEMEDAGVTDGSTTKTYCRQNKSEKNYKLSINILPL